MSSQAGPDGTGSLHPSPALLLLQSCWEMPYIAHFTSDHKLTVYILGSNSSSILTAHSLTCPGWLLFSWLFQQPLRMSPIPPETLERLLLHGCEEGREPESLQMRELMTKLAISRRTKVDAQLIAQFKKGEACSWQHIHAIVKQRLEMWWHEWCEDGEDEQQDDGNEEEIKEAANGGRESKDGAEEDEADSRPLPGQSHDYTGPDFTTFALSCPLPATFTFFSLSLHQRVILLRCFCDDHLAFAADFATTVRGVEAADARIPPLGSDSWGHRYFFFGFPDWRIYREDNAKPMKPRELKADRVKRQQAEAEKQSRERKEDQTGDEVKYDEEEKEEEEDEKAEAGRKAKKGFTKPNGRTGKRSREAREMSASPTPSSKSDDEDDSIASRSRSTSTAPRFQLLTSSPATLLALVTAMRKSAYSKDKALSKQLQTIYDDLEQGKGRHDSGEQGEDGGGEQTGKRKRKDWTNGGEAKRSMRLMLVMAEKEEQERQQKAQAEERRMRAEQVKHESIAELAEQYLRRHGKSNSRRRRGNTS